MPSTKSQRFDYTEDVPGVSSAKAVEKLCHHLGKEFPCAVKLDPNQSTALNGKVTLDSGHTLIVTAYKTDKVNFAASPRASGTEVESVANKILEICRFCTYRITGRSFSPITRTEEILEYVRKVETTADAGKVVAVVLADTVIEIVLTEIMKDKNIKDKPSLKSGMPEKLESLRTKGLPIYKEKDIKQLRQVRNRAVHDGSIPSFGEATAAVKLAADILRAPNRMNSTS